MNPVYVIDNSNFCYKYKNVHKYARVKFNHVSVDTSCLVGYIKSLRTSVFKDFIIVLDGIPKRSKEILPQYKGTREKQTSEELSVSKLELVQFLTKVGSLIGKNIQVVCIPNCEADQVIASICELVQGNVPTFKQKVSISFRDTLDNDRSLNSLRDAVQQDLDLSKFDSVVIGTTDSDMYQLVSDRVSIDNSTSGKKVGGDLTPDAVYNLNPSAIPLYKAIFGDTSDNVPALIPFKSVYIKEFNTVKTSLDLCKIYAFIEQESLDRLIFKQALPGVSMEVYNVCALVDRSLFLRNWEVVKLKFETVPIALKFPDYRIEDTIERYHLRIK